MMFVIQLEALTWNCWVQFNNIWTPVLIVEQKWYVITLLI
jgi:hypothetical protein